MTAFHWFRFLLQSAFRNLWRTPRRTLVSLTAIAAACLSLILFQSFSDGVRRTFRHNIITNYYGNFQISRKGYFENRGDDPYSFPVESVDAIRSSLSKEIPSLACFSRRQEFFALVYAGTRSLGAKGVGIDAAEEKKFLTGSEVVSGRHLADAGPGSIFLGQGLAEQLRVKAGDTLTLVVTTAGESLNASDFEVAGLFRTGVLEIDNGLFYLPFDDASKLLRTQGPSEILLGLSGEGDLRYRPVIERVLSQSFPSLTVTHWHDRIGQLFDNSMRWLDTLFLVFRVIVLVVATLSIANVFTVSLFERLGEFGTLRALGTYRSEVAVLIFLEALAQAFVGTLIGVFSALFLIWVALRSGVTLPPPANMSTPFHVDFWVPWAGLPWIGLLVVAVAGSSGILPALRMARVSIVQALGRNV
jgi:putative ABC transport system permease protein